MLLFLLPLSLSLAVPLVFTNILGEVDVNQRRRRNGTFEWRLWLHSRTCHAGIAEANGDVLQVL